MSEVVIRAAAGGDLDRLLELYDELAEGRAAAAPADRATGSAILSAALQDSARHLIVAELDGRVCGTADMVIVANLTHRGAPWAIIENVVVAADSRRRGVATQMMAHLIELAHRSRCCKAQLLSGKQRTGAHAMYRSTGFEAVAEGFKVYFDG
jgi:GNAT superfamily N-acetyltransferase